MAEQDRPAWSERSLRYLWRPRHRQNQVGWLAIAVVAAVMIGIGVAAYAGFHHGDDEKPVPGAALPTMPYVPGPYPSAAVSVAPAPSTSSTRPVPQGAARPTATTFRPTPAVTNRPPAARAKTP